MWQWFSNLNPIWQAFGATMFTWFLTALGAGVVLFFRTINRKFLDAMLGFAAGVMIAASYWSLLAPAIEMAEEFGNVPSWVPATVGFLAGGLFLWVVDKILPHLHLGFPDEEAEGIKTNWQRSILLVLAITLHNIPEGLAVGVAFGALAADLPSATFAGAVALGSRHRHPEFPGRGCRLRSLAPGRPLALEMLLVRSIVRRGGTHRRCARCHRRYLYAPDPALCPGFAAGAMIYVVVEELIPESQLEKNTDAATMGAMCGFAVMMTLDVALG
jgi:ZIP family zinc transporter